MTTIKRTIMRRVYLIWFFRKVFNMTTAKVGVVLLFAWQFMAQVSVLNVIANSPFVNGDFSGGVQFLQYAFLNTEALTLALLVGIGVFGALLARDLVIQRKLQTSQVFA